MPLDTDIAVIEHLYEPSGEWVAVCYIGPDRDEGEFEARAGDRIRIRYLNRETPAT